MRAVVLDDDFHAASTLRARNQSAHSGESRKLCGGNWRGGPSKFTEPPDKVTWLQRPDLPGHELWKSSGGLARAGGNLHGNDNWGSRCSAIHDDVYPAEFVFDAMTKRFNRRRKLARAFAAIGPRVHPPQKLTRAVVLNTNLHGA